MAQSHTSEDIQEFANQFARKSKITNPGVYIIACEGTKDEPKYIKEFVKRHRIRAQVFIAERAEGDYGSHPTHIVEVLDTNLSKLAINRRSKSIFLWIMIDRDKDREADLLLAKEMCQERGVKIAYSSPCVELWFLLHFKDISNLSKKDRQRLLVPKNLKKHLKRNCLNIDNGYYPLFPKTQLAIDRAKNIEQPTVDFPESYCTRVHLLIQELLSFQ